MDIHPQATTFERIRVVTPVKDSIESTIKTIQSVLRSRISVPYTYLIYNDFSTAENTETLRRMSREMGFELVNLCELTSKPSPNYLLLLQREREICRKENAALMLVESDVEVFPDTLQRLCNGASERTDCGIAASVTIDEDGHINYPYTFVHEKEQDVVDSTKHCSFCCSLLTPRLLEEVDFNMLDSRKDWFDVTISHRSLEKGLHNYIFTMIPAIHRPHASRPWKKLKYQNPVKYYWIKWTRGFDRI